MNVRSLQRALKALGFDPGGIDGVWGRRTSGAVKLFQEAAGLAATGIVDAATEAELERQAGAAPDTSALVWFEEARRLMGVREVAGAGSNREILDWAKNLDIAYAGDDVPWCGLFTAHCVASTLPGEPLPNNPLGARQWSKFGEKTTPQIGAVLVFWREKRDGYKGHVGFYEAEDDEAYHVLGGNQSNSVSIARVAKTRLLGARWPVSAATLATGVTARVDAGGGLSRDEQ